MSTSKRRRARVSAGRAALIERLNLAGRELSTATVMFHEAVAARRGLSATESKALDALLRVGRMTHAELCHETGLAPASVTDLIDRLERKGYAARVPHPEDGRRVLVTVDAPRIHREMAPLFGQWVSSLNELYTEYSDQQLEAICTFLSAAAVRQREATHLLTSNAHR